MAQLHKKFTDGQVCSISLKGPTRFQRRGPPNSAERSDEVILTVYNKPP